MSADETNSLADQAAAWVPPWARQPSAAESAPSEAAGSTPNEAPTESASEALPGEDDTAEARTAESPPEAWSADVEPWPEASSANVSPLPEASAEDVAPSVEEAVAEPSVEAEPVDAEPVDAEPVEDEPVDAEPVDAEPVEDEPSLDAAVGDVSVDAAPPDAEPVDVESSLEIEPDVVAETSALTEPGLEDPIVDEPDESDMSGEELTRAEIPDGVEVAFAGDSTFGDGSGTTESMFAERSLVDERSEATPDGEPKVELSDDELRGAVEAILLIVDEPATEIILAQVLDQPVDRIAAVLERCSREYAEMGRGFELRRVAGGWRLYTRAEYAAYVEKFVLDGQQVRLTQAALETLAVVAYKQPVTRSRISAIRGVNCDGVVRTLVARGLIEECGSEPESGAFLYRTTILFLEKLGLDSVEQLPPLAPFLPDDVDEIADAQR